MVVFINISYSFNLILIICEVLKRTLQHLSVTSYYHTTRMQTSRAKQFKQLQRLTQTNKNFDKNVYYQA